jgi:hypothetical protein
MGADGPGPQRLAEVLAEAIGQLGVASEPQDVPDYLALITIAAGIETQARSLLHEAVHSARSAGATWSAVGRTLGMSKQAAQKRFTAERAPWTSELDPDERILGPVTAFDEMAELALAGRYGWHSVESGASFHRVVRSETQWEHVRVSMLTSRARALRADGWEVIPSEFPYTYLKRDLGTPALLEPGGGATTPSEAPRP